MSAPRVSVVIPTYNQAHFLGEALESVRAQTMPEWDCIVVDNHSEDATETVTKSFGDPRILYRSFRNHGVIGASRNRGTEATAAPWIAFLDSDDAWTPDKLERCLEAATGDVAVIGHALTFVRDGAVVRVHPSGPESALTHRHMLFHGPRLTPSAVLVRRDMLTAVGMFDERPEVATAEDYDLWLKLAWAGARFRVLPEALTRYRLHGGNQSRGVYRHRDASLTVIADHYSRRDPRPLDALRLRRVRARYHYGAARRLDALGDPAAARAEYAQALALFPVEPRCLVGAALHLARGARPDSRREQG